MHQITACSQTVVSVVASAIAAAAAVAGVLLFGATGTLALLGPDAAEAGISFGVRSSR